MDTILCERADAIAWGTVRSLWSAIEVPSRQAFDLAYACTRGAEDREVVRGSQGQRVERRVR